MSMSGALTLPYICVLKHVVASEISRVGAISWILLIKKPYNFKYPLIPKKYCPSTITYFSHISTVWSIYGSDKVQSCISFKAIWISAAPLLVLHLWNGVKHRLVWDPESIIGGETDSAVLGDPLLLRAAVNVLGPCRERALSIWLPFGTLADTSSCKMLCPSNKNFNIIFPLKQSYWKFIALFTEGDFHMEGYCLLWELCREPRFCQSLREMICSPLIFM
jgi:hypothetical protein